MRIYENIQSYMMLMKPLFIQYLTFATITFQISHSFLIVHPWQNACYINGFTLCKVSQSKTCSFHIQCSPFTSACSTMEKVFKGTVSRDLLLLVFLMNQFPPSHRVLHQDRFEFFRKFAEIFASQGAPPVSTICHRCQRYRRQICHRCQQRRWQIATGINDAGGKFATGVNDTGGK